MPSIAIMVEPRIRLVHRLDGSETRETGRARVFAQPGYIIGRPVIGGSSEEVIPLLSGEVER